MNFTPWLVTPTCMTRGHPRRQAFWCRVVAKSARNAEWDSMHDAFRTRLIASLSRFLPRWTDRLIILSGRQRRRAKPCPCDRDASRATRGALIYVPVAVSDTWTRLSSTMTTHPSPNC